MFLDIFSVLLFFFFLFLVIKFIKRKLFFPLVIIPAFLGLAGIYLLNYSLIYTSFLFLFAFLSFFIVRKFYTDITCLFLVMLVVVSLLHFILYIFALEVMRYDSFKVLISILEKANFQEEIVKVFARYIIAFSFLDATLYIWVIISISELIMNRYKIIERDELGFSQFRLPWILIFISFGIWGLWLLKMYGVMNFSDDFLRIVFNLFFMIVILYMYQGIAVLVYYVERRAISPFWLIIGILLLFPIMFIDSKILIFMLLMFSLAGYIDGILDLRKNSSKEEQG